MDYISTLELESLYKQIGFYIKLSNSLKNKQSDKSKHLIGIGCYNTALDELELAACLSKNSTLILDKLSSNLPEQEAQTYIRELRAVLSASDSCYSELSKMLES